MMDFTCNQCGECCTSDRFLIVSGDLIRWIVEERWDILAHIRFGKEGIIGWYQFKRGEDLDSETTNAIFHSFKNGFSELFDPKLHESIEGALLADKCPWIARKRDGTVRCKIHKTKPENCRDWPQKKRQIKDIKCKGVAHA